MAIERISLLMLAVASVVIAVAGGDPSKGDLPGELADEELAIQSLDPQVFTSNDWVAPYQELVNPRDEIQTPEETLELLNRLEKIFNTYGKIEAGPRKVVSDLLQLSRLDRELCYFSKYFAPIEDFINCYRFKYASRTNLIYYLRHLRERYDFVCPTMPGWTAQPPSVTRSESLFRRKLSLLEWLAVYFELTTTKENKSPNFNSAVMEKLYENLEQFGDRLKNGPKEVIENMYAASGLNCTNDRYLAENNAMINDYNWSSNLVAYLKDLDSKYIDKCLIQPLETMEDEIYSKYYTKETYIAKLAGEPINERNLMDIWRYPQEVIDRLRKILGRGVGMVFAKDGREKQFCKFYEKFMNEFCRVLVESTKSAINIIKANPSVMVHIDGEQIFWLDYRRNICNGNFRQIGSELYSQFKGKSPKYLKEILKEHEKVE